MTWNNGRDNLPNFQERIDRAITVTSGKSLFKNHSISNLDFWGSDHRALCIELEGNNCCDKGRAWVDVHQNSNSRALNGWDSPKEDSRNSKMSQLTLSSFPPGDVNTKFFHLKASNRRKKNFITGLEDNASSWKIKENEITSIVEDYFRDLFSSSCVSSDALGSVASVVEPEITS
ncbi:hypothetical protein PanWU01x14_342780 [Parasponia andersonii]|uniref:Endonuclease/exonuclease/phosphatase n=1 Tax=Parasponia andersonii TaxID=3476 RepID=A0A2P5ADL3_PARAD|nr:hypothetical protein PanWU01x14_342780 [Parasponia andersonii]